MSGYICQLLINQEDYLFSRHLNRMVDQLVPQADRDFGLVRLSTKTSHAGEWIDTLQTPSLMFGDRLLVLEDIDKIKKSDQDNFAAFLKEHDLQAHLIVTGSKIDKRTGFYKALNKKAEVIEFKAPYANQLPQFVGSAAKELSLQIDPDAAQTLVDLVGADLRSLVSELEKLKVFLHPKTQATVADVTALVGLGEVNVFDITKNLSPKSYALAYQTIERALGQGESPIKLLALITGHFRRVVLAKELSAKRLPEKDLARELGVHPFFVKDYLGQAKQKPLSRLKSDYQNLIKASWQIRSSGARPETVLRQVVQNLAVKAA